MAPCASQSVGDGQLDGDVRVGVRADADLPPGVGGGAVAVQPPGPNHRAARHRECVVAQRGVAEAFLGLLAEAQLEGEVLLSVVRLRRIVDGGSQRRLRGLLRPLRFTRLTRRRRLRRRLLIGDDQGRGGQLRVAGQRLGVARIVGEGDPHLDGFALVVAGHGVGGACRSLDVGAGADPLVGEDRAGQTVLVLDAVCGRGQRLAGLHRPGDARPARRRAVRPLAHRGGHLLHLDGVGARAVAGSGSVDVGVVCGKYRDNQFAVFLRRALVVVCNTGASNP